MTRHWHAYSYTGAAYSDGQIRAGLAPRGYPPVEIMHWLKQSAGYVDTFTEVPPAVEWLRETLLQHVPLGSENYPIENRLSWARSRLGQEAGCDVVYGYYSVNKRYVSRALISCPRKRIGRGGEEPPPCPVQWRAGPVGLADGLTARVPRCA